MIQIILAHLNGRLHIHAGDAAAALVVTLVVLSVGRKPGFVSAARRAALREYIHVFGRKSKEGKSNV